MMNFPDYFVIYYYAGKLRFLSQTAHPAGGVLQIEAESAGEPPYLCEGIPQSQME